MILLVDDDYWIRDALSRLLEDEGYAVISVGDGNEALIHLRQAAEPPCVILLDLMMPGLNGWEFRSLQRRDPAIASIPVVVLSADRDIRLKAAHLEADGYCQKPIDLNSLLNTIERYCR
jgi:two-component system, chemotaxis family, chemotaxis protein CheY